MKDQRGKVIPRALANAKADDQTSGIQSYA